MQLHVINTGSKGNCYILEGKNTSLIIEAGVPMKDIKEALGFNLRNVAGCIVTHEHNDHSRSINYIMENGIYVYTSPLTFKVSKSDHHNMRPVNPMNKFRVGEFDVLAFDVKHDAVDPLGFFINHPECGNVLFLTDTFYVPYTFKNIHNIIIEANYCQNIVDDRLMNKKSHKVVRDRVMQSHMSIDTCIDTLKANDLTKVNNIVLIHLSDANSNEVEFKDRVTKATGKNVSVASKGMKINFNKTAI